MREFKLFQHYFFNFWREKSRDVLLDKGYLLDQIVESPQALYNVCDAVCFVDDEDFGSKRVEYLGFRQPVAFLYHTGKGAEETLQVKSGRFSNEEWFEVFISGKSFAHSLAHISSKVAKKVTVQRQSDEDGEGTEPATYYLHKTDLPLVRSAKYTVYTPKLFV